MTASDVLGALRVDERTALTSFVDQVRGRFGDRLRRLERLIVAEIDRDGVAL